VEIWSALALLYGNSRFSSSASRNSKLISIPCARRSTGDKAEPLSGSRSGDHEGRRATATPACVRSLIAKHRMWTWNLSKPGLAPPSRSNSISNSISSRPTRTPQIVHSASTPGPPHTRSGRRLGSVAVSMAFDTTSRIVSSSMLVGLWYAQPRTVYGAAERGGKAKCQGSGARRANTGGPVVGESIVAPK
jgi:hypothetical protein